MEVAVLEFRIFQSKSQISEYEGNFRIFVENPGVHPTYDFHQDDFKMVILLPGFQIGYFCCIL